MLSLTIDYLHNILSQSIPSPRSIPGGIPSHSHSPPKDTTPPISSSLMAFSSIFKTFIIPPIIAFTIYLVSIFIIIPLYQRRTRYAQYLPLSIPLPTSSSTQGSYLSRIRKRIIDTLSPFSSRYRWQRRRSQSSEDGLFSDEELEEGLGADQVENGAKQDGEADDGRRLSRELEVGFRDDSDEEVDYRQDQIVRGGRNERRE